MIQTDRSDSPSFAESTSYDSTIEKTARSQHGNPTAPTTRPNQESNPRTEGQNSSTLTHGIVRTQDLHPQRQGRPRPNGQISAARAIWNALAIASMITLVGFGYLSFKLSKDLHKANVQLFELETQQKAQSNYQAQATTAQNRLAELESENSTLKTDTDRLAELNASLVEKNERITTLRQIEQERFELVSAADRIVSMFGTEAAPDLIGTLYLQDYGGSLVLHGLEPLTPAQTYQLWLFTEGGLQIPANLVAVQDMQTPTWTDLTFRQDTPEFVAAGISIEPVGGSISPTSPMLLISQIGR